MRQFLSTTRVNLLLESCPQCRTGFILKNKKNFNVLKIKTVYKFKINLINLDHSDSMSLGLFQHTLFRFLKEMNPYHPNVL